MKSASLRSTVFIGLISGVLVVVAQGTELLIVSKVFLLDFSLAGIALLSVVLGFHIAKWTISTDLNSGFSVNPIESLTAREMDIFFLIYSGKTNKEIANMYFVEVSTIKTHINNLYCKLNVSNRKEAREKYKKYISSSAPPFIHPA